MTLQEGRVTFVEVGGLLRRSDYGSGLRRSIGDKRLHGMNWTSMIGSVAGLLLVGLLAGDLPARRTLRVDPMVSLRYE